MGIRQPPNPSSRLRFRGLAGPPFSRSGPGLGAASGAPGPALRGRSLAYHPPSPTSPLTAWAVCILSAPELPETAPQGSPKPAGVLSAGFQEAPPPPGGRSDPLPSPRASAPPPGDPLSPTASLAPQDTPLRRPGLVVPPPPPPRPRPPRPAPRQAPGEPGAPTPPPERPARKRDWGGDGDWAAAWGRVLGREAPRLLSFSAPAPLSPSLIAPPAAAEVGALASSPPPAGDPLLSPPLPPPLAAASSSLSERLAARRRNGKPRRGEGCELGAGDAEPGSGELESPGPLRAAGGRARSPGQVGRAAPAGSTPPRRWRDRRGRRSPGCVSGGWRGNLVPAPPEPTGREEDSPRDRDGCRMLGMEGSGCFGSHRRRRRQQKWKNCS